MSMIQDENFPAEICFKSYDGEVTDENSETEDIIGLLDNLYGNELNSHAELAPSCNQIDATDFEKLMSSFQAKQANEVYKDQHENKASKPSFYKILKQGKSKLSPLQDPMFPEAVYGKYRDFFPWNYVYTN